MNGIPTITTSERSSFRRCPQQWKWRFVDGLAPKGASPDALWFGIGTHIALAEWYKLGLRRGPHPADTFEDWIGDEFREIRASREEWYDEPNYEDAKELGIAMLENYINKYGRDERWHIISIETPFRVKVTWHGKTIAYFNSTWDGVARDLATGLIILLEHKTASQIATAYLALDDQAGSYWAVASAILRARGVLKASESIAGIQYNFLRKTIGDDRPQDEGGAYLNKDGSVSKKQPPLPFVRPELVERGPAEQKIQMERLAAEVANMNAMRRGDMPIYENTNRDCTYCPFFDMCQLHERGGVLWKEVAKHDFVKVDPYERYKLKSAA